MMEIKVGKTSASGIFVIEINMCTTSFKNWIFDSGFDIHMCTDVQDLQISRRLASREIDLRVGNGTKVAALAVGTYILELPLGHVLNISYCYYVPSLTSNIIFVSCLAQCGYTFVFRNTWCFVYKNGFEICSADIENGLYILNINKSQTYNMTNKMLKLSNNDETYMWRCCI